MNIKLLYDVQDSPWGGVNSFFRNFGKYAAKDRRVTLVDSSSRADIILTVGNYSGPGKKLSSRRLWWASKCGGISWSSAPTSLPRYAKSKVLFRLDGLRKIYTGNWNASDKLLIRNLKFADGLIFQSQFSKESFDNFGLQLPSNQLVINNGADQEVFFPEKARRFSVGKDLVLISNSWSTNSYKGFHNIAAVSRQKNVRILHIGRWPEGVSQENVAVLGVIGPREIATIFRQGDFFFFPSKNEACPNVLFEALACGLPPIYLNSGGNAEICGEGKFGIPFEENTIENGQILELVVRAREKHDEIRANIIAEINRFSFTRCLNEYLAFFESQLV